MCHQKSLLEVTLSQFTVLKHSHILFFFFFLPFQLFSSFLLLTFFIELSLSSSRRSMRGEIRALKVDVHPALTQRNPFWRTGRRETGSSLFQLQCSKELPSRTGDKKSNVSASLNIWLEPMLLPMNIITFSIIYDTTVLHFPWKQPAGPNDAFS